MYDIICMYVIYTYIYTYTMFTFTSAGAFIHSQIYFFPAWHYVKAHRVNDIASESLRYIVSP